MNDLFTDDLVTDLSRALIHFVWQGVAVWIAAELLIWPACGCGPRLRYFAYASFLTLLAALPIVTFCTLRIERSVANDSGYEGEVQHDAVRPAPLVQSFHVSALANRTAPLGMPPSALPIGWLAERVYVHPAFVVRLWLIGVAAYGLRLIVGSFGLWRLVRERQPLPPDVERVVARLVDRLAFRVRPTMGTVEQLSQAIAVGIFKPMVLLPAAWVCELPPEVLQAVLAHELVHLRRWDLAINGLQRLVETLLFFHPVVWWCSRRLRIEREMCCDLAASCATGNQVVYAKALALLAERQRAPFVPLLAAGIGGTKMVMLERIRNVLGVRSPGRPRRILLLVAIAGIVLPAAVAITWLVRTDDRANAVSHVPQIVGPNATFAAGYVPPTERDKWTLPTYTIEPPDVLSIEVIRLVPKPPYRIQSTDILRVEVEGTPNPIGAQLVVDPEGRIDLGPRLGKVQVVGLTTDEAKVSVGRAVGEIYNEELLQVSITLSQSCAMQPIIGEHLVSPDGTVNLGVYGQVWVAGQTVEQAIAAIESQLAETLDRPRVAVSVFAYNSKVYYVITKGAGLGDNVVRFPITGSETVLDALAQVKGLNQLSMKQIWIVRPTPDGNGADLVLPVDWETLTSGSATDANYQVLPGDRIFIADRRSTWNPFGW